MVVWVGQIQGSSWDSAMTLDLEMPRWPGLIWGEGNERQPRSRSQMARLKMTISFRMLIDSF
jgi:hypothetical protein